MNHTCQRSCTNLPLMPGGCKQHERQARSWLSHLLARKLSSTLMQLYCHVSVVLLYELMSICSLHFCTVFVKPKTKNVIFCLISLFYLRKQLGWTEIA